MATLGRHLGCSKQAISKQIRVLVDRGYLEVSNRYRKDGGQSSNLYRIRFDEGAPDTETLTDPDYDSDAECLPPVNHNTTPPRKPLEVDAPRKPPEVDGILERPSSFERPSGTVEREAPVTVAPKKSGGQKRGTRLPDDWSLPDDWLAWAQEQRSGVDARTEGAKFADYWHAKAGKDATKLDWFATWRNWIRNARPSAESKPNSYQGLAKKDYGRTRPGILASALDDDER